MQPIAPKENAEPMNVVVFGSGSGTNLQALINAQKQNKKFIIKAVFTDRKCRCQDIALAEGIPLIYLSYKNFLQDNNTKTQHDYYSEVLKLVKQTEKKYSFTTDILFLAGYMRLVTEPLLSAYKNKILNVHPADLTVKNPDGSRRYIGANAVSMALEDGQSETRSCVILIDETIDGGPIVVLGPAVKYEGPHPITKESAAAHQEKQKQQSDWPAAITALSLFAEKLKCEG